MSHVVLPNLHLPASRLAIGIDASCADESSAPLLDQFFDRGCNVFETARAYHSGRSERILGRWLSRRGVRRQVIVISKGAHTPNCNPEALSKEL